MPALVRAERTVASSSFLGEREDRGVAAEEIHAEGALAAMQAVADANGDQEPGR